jgi:hypothetical protein
MQIDVRARGFSLTSALQHAIEEEAQQYAARCPNAPAGAGRIVVT